MRYHVKDDGNPGACSAQPGNCPFGSTAPHFESEQEARAHMEVTNAAFMALETKLIPGSGRERTGPNHVRNHFFRMARDEVLASGTNKELADSFRRALVHFGGKCYICGEPCYEVADGKARKVSTGNHSGIQADHLVPPGMGGSGSPGNMVPAHSVCNGGKSEKPLEEILQHNPAMLAKVQQFMEAEGFVPAESARMPDLTLEIEAIWNEARLKIESLKAKYHS